MVHPVVGDLQVLISARPLHHTAHCNCVSDHACHQHIVRLVGGANPCPSDSHAIEPEVLGRVWAKPILVSYKYRVNESVPSIEHWVPCAASGSSNGSLTIASSHPRQDRVTPIVESLLHETTKSDNARVHSQCRVVVAKLTPVDPPQQVVVAEDAAAAHDPTGHPGSVARHASIIASGYRTNPVGRQQWPSPAETHAQALSIIPVKKQRVNQALLKIYTWQASGCACSRTPLLFYELPLVCILNFDINLLKRIPEIECQCAW